MISRETFKKAEKGRKSYENVLQNDLEQGRESEQHPQGISKKSNKIEGGVSGNIAFG